MVEEIYCACGQKAGLERDDWSSGIGISLYTCPACNKQVRIAVLGSEIEAVAHYKGSNVRSVNMFKDAATGQLLFSEAGYPWPATNPLAPNNAVVFVKTLDTA